MTCFHCSCAEEINRRIEAGEDPALLFGLLLVVAGEMIATLQVDDRARLVDLAHRKLDTEVALALERAEAGEAAPVVVEAVH